ncbi:hypothetical protein AB0M43_36475 [Longispora sp. NPDC051575]|uniref:hypothetical protein n=1 Tax=Longispora sp. NPDC051575 TaxID=3154943 RepID=UPI00343921A1
MPVTRTSTPGRTYAGQTVIELSRPTRPWRWIAAAAAGVIALVITVAAFTTDSRDPVPAGSSWQTAGVAHLELSGGEDLLVDADTHTDLNTLALADAYVLRLARIAWRTVPGRLSSVTVTVTSLEKPAGNATRRFAALELLLRVGPRPAGMDSPSAPGPSPTTTARPAPTAPVGDPSQMQVWWSDVTARTVVYFGQTTPASVVPGCQAGGQPVTVPVAVNGTAESWLPWLAAYWQALGMATDTRDLDAGAAQVSATVSGRADLGKITARSSGDDHGEQWIWLDVTTCPPAPSARPAS